MINDDTMINITTKVGIVVIFYRKDDISLIAVQLGKAVLNTNISLLKFPKSLSLEGDATGNLFIICMNRSANQ